MKSLKIGIFGGAFDPVHEGHLHIAELARQKLQLDRVYFVPLNQAVHKEQPLLKSAERLKLLQKMLRGKKYLEIYTGELKRGGASYAIDTVQEFFKTAKRRWPQTEINLYYIIGTDAFEKFFTWREPERLLQLVNFIIVSRPGYSFKQIERQFLVHQYRDYLDKLFLLEDSGIDISSTKIREREYGRSK